MNIIFLDVDGVLNCADGKYELEPGMVENLSRLVDVTDAKIVLTSSWRVFFTRDKNGNLVDSKLYQYGKPGKASKLIDILAKYGLEIFDTVADIDHANAHRGEEIRNWLETHDVDNFVILDDDKFDFKKQGLHEHHVRTHAGVFRWIPAGAQGLTQSKMIDALMILKPELFKW